MKLDVPFYQFLVLRYVVTCLYVWLLAKRSERRCDMQGLRSRIAIAMYRSQRVRCEVIFMITRYLLDWQAKMLKSNAIASYRQKCCSVIPCGFRKYARCTVLHSLEDSVVAAGSSGNATKLSSPLNFLFESLVSGDRPCGCESIQSK